MDFEFLSSDPQDKLIEAYVLGDSKESPARASTALNSLLIKLSRKETNLLSVVKDLQSYLTSTNQTHRSRGCLLLADTLDRCQNLSLSSQEFISLYEFFISKMTDIATTLEAVRSINNFLARNNSGEKIYDDDRKLFDLFHRNT